MILDIKVIKSEAMFCLESVVASVARYLNRNYQMMFSGMWGFQFLSENSAYPGQIGHRVTAGFTDQDVLKLLEIYHGVKVEIHRIKHADTLMTGILRELKEGRPAAFSLNEMHYPWTSQKRARNGFLLVVGYQAERSLLCLDIQSKSQEVRVFPLKILLELDEVFKNSAENYFTFSIVSEEIQTIGYDDIRSILANCRSLSADPFTAMRCFAECIEQEMDYDVERGSYSSNDLYHVPLLYNVMHILRARKLLSNTVYYLWERTQNQLLSDLSMDFSALGNAWSQVWNLLFKLFYISKDSSRLRSRIAAQIRRIADQEEAVISGVIRDEYHHQLIFSI